MQALRFFVPILLLAILVAACSRTEETTPSVTSVTATARGRKSPRRPRPQRPRQSVGVGYAAEARRSLLP